MFNRFHNRVEFGTILEGLRNFGGGGGFETPQTPTLVKPLATHKVIFTVLLPEMLLQDLLMLRETKPGYLAMHSTIDRCWTEQPLL